MASALVQAERASLWIVTLFLTGRQVRPGLWNSWEESKRTVLKGGSGDSLGKILPDLTLLDFWIVDVDKSFFGQEVTDEGDGGRFTSVTRIGLEGKPKNSDTL